MAKKIWGTLDPFFEKGPYLGRIVANSGFLKALLELDPFDEYHFFLASEKQASYCRSFTTRHLGSRNPKIKYLSRMELVHYLRKNPYHAFHLSDCINHPAHLARLRNKYSRNIFPVTSITHSLSYSNYGHNLMKQLWAGWSAKDTIICSSQCAMQVLENYFGHLKKNYQLTEDFRPPEMRHIPLGIDFYEFRNCFASGDNSSASFKKDKINILCLGRISCYSKMDILPILKSFQLARFYGLKLNELRLILAGGLDQKDDTVGKLSVFAKNMGLELAVFPNPDNAFKKKLLKDADIFLSLSDNPQETFGLTVLEAQAAGTPVIASDYNGYRELIAHGVDGFLIPTLGPDSTEYIDDLAPLIYDSESHLLLAQQCAVDLHALAGTIARLVADPLLRKTIAANGIMNARKYDWTRIIRMYTRLWDQLHTLTDSHALEEISHPVHTPYGHIFAAHPTSCWLSSTVSLGKLGQALYRKKDHPVIYSGMADFIDWEKLRTLLFHARSPLKGSVLVARLSAVLELDPSLTRILTGWAIKQGFLQTSPEPADQSIPLTTEDGMQVTS